jgi:hypothetical protein
VTGQTEFVDSLCIWHATSVSESPFSCNKAGDKIP